MYHGSDRTVQFPVGPKLMAIILEVIVTQCEVQVSCTNLKSGTCFITNFNLFLLKCRTCWVFLIKLKPF